MTCYILIPISNINVLHVPFLWEQLECSFRMISGIGYQTLNDRYKCRSKCKTADRELVWIGNCPYSVTQYSDYFEGTHVHDVHEQNGGW